MNPNMLPVRFFFCSFKNTFFFITIFFFLLLQTALSADRQFEACVPHNCGTGPNISYPFWIDTQESYCGYPVYNISCLNQWPFIKNLGYDHYIKDILYGSHSLLISNHQFSNPSCPFPLQDLPQDLGPYQLNYSNNLELNYYFNCTGPFPDSGTSYNISCLPNNSTHYSFIYFGPPISDYLNCDSHIIKPVVNEEEFVKEKLDDGNYHEVLQMGFLLEWITSDNSCSGCELSGGHCGYNRSISDFLCFCPDRPYLRRCNDSKPSEKKPIATAIAIATAIGGFIGILTIVILLLWLLRRKFFFNNIFMWKGIKNNSRNVEVFLKAYGSLGPKRYNYKDVKKMTDSFRDKLGQGGYGVVYKGKLLDGRCVAVKVLSESKGKGEEFINEVASIGRTEHVNVVSLLGFCSEGHKRALIYEFMPNGSLEKFIFTKDTGTSHDLGWTKLYQIAVGSARGLEYLHRGCNTRILHFDIKPHNILLDKDFCPKISDFGLAKLCPTRQSTISMHDARGTVGYIAPEVCCRNFGGISSKSDVYSYGMMVLEMVGGRKNIEVGVENTSEIFFPHWIHNRLDLNDDLGLGEHLTEEEEEIARKMIIVGLWCIQTYPATRPAMNRVLDMLEGSLEVLQMPPKPILSAPSRSNEVTSTTLQL